MIIYFNPNRFPDTLEKCYVNDDICKLNQDIEFIPAVFNLVVLSDLSDEWDWQEVHDNWELFIDYLICTIQDQMEEANYHLCDGLSCIEIFENEFDIIRDYKS